MRKICYILLIVCLSAIPALAQESGNRVYDRQQKRTTRPGDGSVYSTESRDIAVQFIDAYVLLNAPPDEFIAVFGVAQEGEQAVESNQKVNDLLESFINAIGKLGIKRTDIYVDFITQNRIYSFIPENSSLIREKLTGFETKKTVAVRYRDRALLEKLLLAAAQSSIFDLIKVDYIIHDMPQIRTRLFEQAVRVIQQKQEDYSRVLNFPLRRQAIFTEKYDTKFPSELYQTYTAFESGTVDNNYSSSAARIIRARKSSTSFLDPLDSSDFDAVINPLGVEPMVQCTLYLKVKFWITP